MAKMKFDTPFANYVCEGDTITTSRGKWEAKATVYRDDCGDSPDQRDDGFWPSRNKADAGYVPAAKFSEAQKHAERVMAAWKADEWYYCGVAVTVSYAGIELTHKYGAALWGIECNYPGSDNAYLRDVANELIDEAMAEAKVKLAELRD
jgi:hypothetical protein